MQDSVGQAFIAVKTSSGIYHIDITAHQLEIYKKGLAERAPPLCVFQTPDYKWCILCLGDVFFHWRVHSLLVHFAWGGAFLVGPCLLRWDVVFSAGVR